MESKPPFVDRLFGKFAASAAKRTSGCSRRGFISRMAGTAIFLLAIGKFTKIAFGQESGIPSGDCYPDPGCGCCGVNEICNPKGCYYGAMTGCCYGAADTYYTLDSCSQICCGDGPPIDRGNPPDYPQRCCYSGVGYFPNGQYAGDDPQGCCHDYGAYDSLTQGCCSGHGIYDLSTQGCCSDGIYDLCTQGCCSGITYSLANECCCPCGCIETCIPDSTTYPPPGC